MAPLRQGSISQSSMFIPQLSPVNPIIQVQWYPFIRSWVKKIDVAIRTNLNCKKLHWTMNTEIRDVKWPALELCWSLFYSKLLIYVACASILAGITGTVINVHITILSTEAQNTCAHIIINHILIGRFDTWINAHDNYMFTMVIKFTHTADTSKFTGSEAQSSILVSQSSLVNPSWHEQVNPFSMSYIIIIL